MKRSRASLRNLAVLFAAGLGLSYACAARADYVMSDPAVKPQSQPQKQMFDGDPRKQSGTQMSSGEGGNYDYYTANRNKDLATYLALVTLRHASEHTWSVFWSGKYAEAQGDCEYALERFPNHPRALHLLCEIANVTNNTGIMIPAYEHALALYPQYAFTHAQYGRYLYEIGAIAAALEQLREAVRLDPNQFQAKTWLAEAEKSIANGTPTQPVAEKSGASKTGASKTTKNRDMQ